MFLFVSLLLFHALDQTTIQLGIVVITPTRSIVSEGRKGGLAAIADLSVGIEGESESSFSESFLGRITYWLPFVPHRFNVLVGCLGRP